MNMYACLIYQSKVVAFNFPWPINFYDHVYVFVQQRERKRWRERKRERLVEMTMIYFCFHQNLVNINFLDNFLQPKKILYKYGGQTGSSKWHF